MRKVKNKPRVVLQTILCPPSHPPPSTPLLVSFLPAAVLNIVKYQENWLDFFNLITQSNKNNLLY